MTRTRALIVGAGPAGLAVAGQLRKRDIPFSILEKGSHIAQSWHDHYDRLHLHTVKRLSHLPDAPFPSEYPRYVSRDQLARYYDRYAKDLGIEPLFETEVAKVSRSNGTDGSAWSAITTSGAVFLADAVVFATGVNRVPHRPALPGEDQFAGRIVHSREYKNPSTLGGKRTLVVGMGNTGAEIALDLVEEGRPVALSIRGPVNIVPRDVLGRPTQLTAIALSKLPDRLNNRLGVLLRRLTVGDLSRYGIATPEIPPIEQLRRYGKTPVIDLGTVRRIKKGDIAVYPAIERLFADVVRFSDGREAEFDRIVLATGYHAQIEDLLEDCDGLFNTLGVPSEVIGRGRFEGLYFVGFNNTRAGGVLGMINEECRAVGAALGAAER